MHVLVVDDNAAVREALHLAFALRGVDVALASTPAEALRKARDPETGAVLQDMNFSQSATTGDEGVALFRDLRAQDPDLPIVLMTAWTDVQTAVQLVREGADDYIAKPWDDERLVASIKRLIAAREVQRARETGTNASVDLAGLVYASPEMHSVVALALRVADSDVPVLITGPSGAGKERIAALLHANSRRTAPMTTLNAGALPTELVEAELFGAEAGAFTGATTLRRGLFETASDSTLFLDEIGTLPASGQAALLRVLETGEFRRLGSSRTMRSGARVVAATNADLAEAVAAGRFREDLYFRLAVIELHVPPLADRPDDIEPLAEHFLSEAGLGPDALEGAARTALRQHPWPGNVRELRNAIQRAALVKTGTRVGAADLGLRSAPGRVGSGLASDDADAIAIRAALREADGVVSRAAAALGLSRQALYRRMDRLGIRVERRIEQ